MINKSVTEMIEAAERQLCDAEYPSDHKPRLWDPKFIIAITHALIAIAKGLEDLRKEIRNK